ncbi:zona pellucida-binding protein 1-like isoform X3 [Chiloscyllium plagiosum]|uniref:zona pellucida-binding protein 1-like isoform X3 n=1 Tax=Chiloscyllium plagiosum TaxID=36176 RepID=UPI001CB87253|nr:zona pellucida-binding protein 1-like isoform X3 [Chiloscyllium plagiosum]
MRDFFMIIIVCLLLYQRKATGDQSNKNSDNVDDNRPVKTLTKKFLRFTKSLLRTSQITEPIHRIFGREGETVEVLIPLRGSPVAIYCLTPELRQNTISNPSTYWWREGESRARAIGEGDQYRVRLDGSLMLLNWETSQATGLYFCTMTHFRHQEEHSLTLRFCLLAYHMPFQSLQVGAQLKTMTCEQRYVKNSITPMKSALDALCEKLSCQINLEFDCTQWGTSPGTMEHHIQLKIAVQPQGEDAMIPCKTGQECPNEETLRKAYENIHAFLAQSESNLMSNNMPPLYYMEGTFKAMKVDHCLIGMGKLSDRNSPCMGCCVTCGPGSYSPNWTAICIPCPMNFYQNNFGKSQCQACPIGLRTNGEGAMSLTDCNTDGIQGRLFESYVKATKQARMAEKVAKAQEDGQILSSTQLLVTIVLCSLAFLGAAVLTIYCLVVLLCKEDPSDWHMLRMKENANLKRIRSPSSCPAMREHQKNNICGTWIK